MSVDGDTASNIDSVEEEMDKVNSASGSKICKDSAIRSEAKENLNVEPELISKKDIPSDKKKEMPEIKKMGKPMVGLPPINVAELTTILQNPAMPSQDLMKEIADKIKIRNEENESNAKSISSVNPLGMSSVFDCIMEVTLTHSDESSDEEENQHELHILEIPCDYCKKIFGSTMSLKTHVLMSHSQDDPSVLNMRLRASIDDDRARELCSENVEGQNKTSKQEKEGEVDLKLRSASEISDEAAPTKSPTALDSTLINSSCKPSLSSLRKRKLSTENQGMNKSTPDLKQTATKTAKSESSSSGSPSKSTTLSVKSGKRKSDDSSTRTQSIGSGKRSRRSVSGENKSGKQKEAVQLRRSSRNK